MAVTLHEMASGELPSWGDGMVEARLLDPSSSLASTMPSPQDGSSPLAISCKVTATAYRSAAASYSGRRSVPRNGSR